MKNFAIVILIVSFCLAEKSLASKGDLYNWPLDDFKRSELERIRHTNIDNHENVLEKILEDFNSDPVVLNFNEGSIKKVNDKIELHSLWAQKKEEKQVYLFALNGTSYFIVYEVKCGDIVRKYMTSSWSLST